MYNKTIWKDRVVDPVSGAVVQEGTFMSAEHFNNIEDGIAAVDSAIADISGGYEDIEEALETGVGTTVSLTLNQSTFVLNLALKNSKGTKISEQSVDLPIESMIVNAEYVASTKSLVLTLQSGSTVTVPLSGLINGLVNDTRKVAGIDLKDDITVLELKNALDVDDLERNKVNITTTVNGKALSSNITLAGNDLKLNATSYTKDTTAKTISKDTKVDEAVAQIEYRLDKKVDKATASTSQYTTSTVTVPACLGYAGVKMVGGKTVKNLFSGYTNMGNYTTATETYNGHTCIKSTSAWSGAYDGNLTLKAGRTYYVSAKLKTSESEITIFLQNNNSDVANITTSAANTWETFDYIYTPQSDVNMIRIESCANVTTIISEFMVVEIDTPCDYIEPATLANGAVEKIVSIGKNLIDVEIASASKDGITLTNNGNGTYTVNGTTDSAYAMFTVKYDCSKFYGKTLRLIGTPANYNGIGLEITDKIVYGASDRGGGDNFSPYNTGNDYYVMIVIYPNTTVNNVVFKPMLTYDNSATYNDFVPYVKTTISVTDAIKNLPDYGCSVGGVYNWVDFKNGVYHHNVKSVDMGSLTWSPYTLSGHEEMRTTLTNSKTYSSSEKANIICSLYDADTCDNVWNHSKDKIIGKTTEIEIYDSNYINSSETFRNHVSGKYIIYELATPELIPISAFITPVSCEEGGTITLVNEHSLDVPNKIVYKKEVI